MCYCNIDLEEEVKRLRWEATIREAELDRLYKLEDKYKATIYGTKNT